MPHSFAQTAGRGAKIILRRSGRGAVEIGEWADEHLGHLTLSDFISLFNSGKALVDMYRAQRSPTATLAKFAGLIHPKKHPVTAALFSAAREIAPLETAAASAIATQVSESVLENLPPVPTDEELTDALFDLVRMGAATLDVPKS